MAWLELTDVNTDFDKDSSEWASETLAGSTALMESFGYRLRGHGVPAGRAFKIPASATLVDAHTNLPIRAATPEEWMAARSAPAPGFIVVAGRSCVVVDD